MPGGVVHGKKTDRIQDKRLQSEVDSHLFAMLRTGSERREGPQAWVKTGLGEELIVICRMAGGIAQLRTAAPRKVLP
ncbi:MAG: hypothetical protein H6Q98_538 [Nitrospirae bacterium]|nr:hypothetical protein [Nitrospirota bacterium]